MFRQKPNLKFICANYVATKTSFVPSSPVSAACLAMVRDSKNDLVCMGPSKQLDLRLLPTRGNRGVIDVSATSCDMAVLTPPSV
jgi:hypothetical protein